MNDISVKPVHSPKESTVEIPVAGVVDNEVDPLALDDEVVKVKEEQEVKAGNCDDNAKEESASKSPNEDVERLALQSDKIKGKLL